MDTGPRGEDLPGLIAAAQSGDAAALDSVLAAVWPDGYRIARSVLRDRGLAEDAAQEACARLVAALPSLRRPEAFRLWFYRLVTHEAYRRLRREPRETALDPALDEHGPATSPPREDLLDLRRAVGALPPTYRLPVLLRYYLDLSDQEVARVVGTTAGAVRVRLAVARRRLRRALQEPESRTLARPKPGRQNAST